MPHKTKRSDTMSERKKQLCAGILILIFALYYANISFFYHSHTINGLTMSHSHFHGAAHTKSGTHTASELSLISVLSAFQSLLPSACMVGMGGMLHVVTVFRITCGEKPVSASPGSIRLRAPPAFCQAVFLPIYIDLFATRRLVGVLRRVGIASLFVCTR